MEIKYDIIFEKHGALKTPSGLMENEVWLDVGNSLGMGCFDHHQHKGYESAFSALVHNTHFLENVIKSAEDHKNVTIHLHEEPDLDCVASFYAVKCCLEKGMAAFQKQFLEGVGAAFERYICEIDNGRNKVTDYPTLTAVFSLLDAGKEKSEETDRYVVDKGLELVETVWKLMETKNIDPARYDLTRELQNSFAPEIEAITHAAYEKEKKDKKISFENIFIWTKDGSAETKKAAIWKDIPLDLNGYAKARKEDSLVTVVPYAVKGKNGSAYTRVFVSINPDMDKDNRYTLRPLAEIIEQMEQMEEQKLYEQTGTYRRDHSHPREKTGLMGEKPFSATSDPWFVKPKEDVFDAPRDLSLLSYDDILGVIRHNGSAVKRSYVLRISGSCETVSDRRMVSVSAWQNDIRKLLKEPADHYVVWGELDASLIRTSNDILKAYCMNLVGSSFHEEKGKVRFLDYRTCIYTDLRHTIILTGTYEGAALEDSITNEILNTDNRRAFADSILIRDIISLIKHRKSLLEFGRRMAEINPGNRKAVENLHGDILRLSADIQKDDLIDNTVEKEICSYMKEQMGISELKSSLTEEIGIMVNESRNRLVARFNILSAFAVPFILMATVFQAGIVRFEEMLNLTGRAAYAGWGIVILLTAILIIALAGVNKGGRGKGKS